MVSNFTSSWLQYHIRLGIVGLKIDTSNFYTQFLYREENLMRIFFIFIPEQHGDLIKQINSVILATL